ncbi:hypothetical protein DF041_09300 [Burkholderia cepacia]|nr:hypothetical protein DF041_09300 [Burkholderia cepacia]
MPEIAHMAASLVACLARPNGAPHFLPYERFRAFACAFHIQADPCAAGTRRLRYLVGKRSLGLFGGVELCCRIIGIYPNVCRTQNSFHLEMDAASSWTLLNSANS